MNGQVGGYDLICWTRNVVHEYQALDSSGHDTGNACFASGWYDELLAALTNFVNVTGLSMYETDGPYPYVCPRATFLHLCPPTLVFDFPAAVHLSCLFVVP